MSDGVVSRVIGPWHLGGLSLWQLVQRVRSRYREGRLDALSAQFAHFAMLVITPLLILLVAITARLPWKGLLDTVLENTDIALPESAYELIAAQVRGIQQYTTPHLVIVALLLFCYAGTRLFGTVVRGLNIAFDVEESRGRFHVYGVALLLALGALVVLLLAQILMVIGPHLKHWLSDPTQWPTLTFLLSAGSRWTITSVAVLLSTSVIYWLAPSVRRPWHPVTPGSVIALAGWTMLSCGFRFYVDHVAHYNETYGALAGVIVMMLWLYFTAVVFFLGGLTEAAIHESQLQSGLRSS